MSTTALVTAAELLRLPTGTGNRYELVAGELRVMSPAGWEHGGIAANVAALLGPYIRSHDLGRAFGAETGFLLRRNPDTVRAPDFAFVGKERMPSTKPLESYWPGAPDLAVEVLSPSDKSGDIAEKIEEWLSAGCKAVWVVDPKLQTVTIYRSPTDIRVCTVDERLSGDPLMPGFACAVGEIFR